ncbi:MAG TPA: site-specific integrase [Terriglobales bacterium]|jgi:integrase
MTARYQRGNLTLKPRKGANVWEFRWYGPDGKQRSKLLGSVAMLPSRADAERAADSLRLEINSELPKAVPITVSALIGRYLNDDIEMGRLAYSTQRSYRSFLTVWVKKQWGDCRLENVRTMAVEQWFRDLQLAPKTKLHLRNVMHVLFECAARWELIRDNPITRVRQGGSRLADPDVLAPEEFRALLAQLKQEPYRTMVTLSGCLGLTRSEITGLKWADFDWNAHTLTVQRGMVNCHVGNPKTQARRKPIPLAPDLVTVLQEWRSQTAFPADSDWLFASPAKDGATPYWPDSVLSKIIQPAAKRAQLTKHVGWHTFRHSYSTLLRANGTDVKVQSELLRHANIQTTLQIYTQAVSDQKRAAHEHVVGQLLAV